MNLRTMLQLAAVLVLAGAFTFWLARGANRGWTKTSVPVKTLDPVLGIEGISYEKRFIPGVEFVAGATLIAVFLTGGSLLVRRK